MDHPTFFLLFSFLLTFIYAITKFDRHNSRLPPGPNPLPIIGNLLELSDKPHHSLAALSKRYGPLMSLKLGSKTTIVISSPDIAKEFFLTHDKSISSRSVPDTARIVDHAKYSIAWLQVQELLDHVDLCCTNEKAVNIGGVAFTTALNVLSNFIFSMDFAQYDSISSQEFKDAVWALMELGGKPNLADFFPILRLFDPQGLVRQGNVYGRKLMDILDRIIDQRLQTRTSMANNDILDMLLNLNLKDESEFSRNDMRHLFLAFFIAGMDTTSSTLEWALAELIRNPEKMEAARSEVTNINKNNICIQESDISRFPYLHAIIKETLHLHPPAPFLVPHQAIHDLNVQGFIVPRKSQILCNVWAMGRDPKVWSEPEMFVPERFLEVNIDYKGQDFELIPFGAGRRICPGLNLAHRLLHIMLGSLIQKFDWKLEENKRAQGVDMGEKFGLTLSRRVPLMAIPIKL